MSSSVIAQTSSHLSSWIDEKSESLDLLPWRNERSNLGVDGLSNGHVDWIIPVVQDYQVFHQGYPEDIILDDVEASTPPDDDHMHEIYALPMPPIDGRGRRGAIFGPLVVRELDDSREESDHLKCFEIEKVDEFQSKTGTPVEKFEQSLPVRVKTSTPSNNRSHNQLTPDRSEKVISSQKSLKAQKKHVVKPTFEGGIQQYSSFEKQYHTETSPLLDFLKGTSHRSTADELKVGKQNGRAKLRTGCFACR
jgi:hypothetical protein